MQARRLRYIHRVHRSALDRQAHNSVHWPSVSGCRMCVVLTRQFAPYSRVFMPASLMA